MADTKKPDIGPRNICIGIPTTAAGAGMVDLGTVRRVVQKLEPRKKMPKDVYGNDRPASAVVLGAGGTVELDVPRAVGESVKKFSSLFAADGTFVARGSTVAHRSMAVIHPDAIEGAAADPLTRWYHAIDDVTIPDLENNTEDGDATEEYVTMVFSFGYVDETQDGVAIPEALQPFAAGDEVGALGYSLPAAYAAAP